MIDMALQRKKRILICPLDWGLGHATRCIPVIRELLSYDAEVIIGADDRPLALLKKEFPQLKFIKFPGYAISYPAKSSMVARMLWSLPKILYGIYKEHWLLGAIIKRYEIDAVISDNRYGLWNNNVPSVFITHQVSVKCAGFLKPLEPILFRLNKFFIDKYDECWIPDSQGDNSLSGDLSDRYDKLENIHFIGKLSRFDRFMSNNGYKDNSRTEYKYDLMVTLSGPEPQRTVFENIVMKQLKTNGLKTIVVRGITGDGELDEKYSENDQIEIYPHLETEKMCEALLSAKLILSRPGYSTLMDLAALGKKAVLVPTPGQTEQEYLAERYFKKGIFYKMSQEKFDLDGIMDRSNRFEGIKEHENDLPLKSRVKELISRIKA